MTSLLETISVETTEFVLLGKKSSIGKRLAFHPVQNEVVGQEVPFLKENAEKIFSLFKDFDYQTKQFEGLIPKEIIFAKDDPSKGLSLIWTRKKQSTPLLFTNNHKNLEGIYQLPTLLFSFKANTLKVFAIADQDAAKINLDTILYQPPFFNVNNQGVVCMGNINLNKVKQFLTFEKAKGYLENSFFQSQFSHSNDDKVITEAYLLEHRNCQKWTKNKMNPLKYLNNLI
jgi:PRTRC genetic system protein B